MKGKLMLGTVFRRTTRIGAVAIIAMLTISGARAQQAPDYEAIVASPDPPDVANLDIITFFFAYHDITYMEVDRARMNSKMLAALKPGGFLIIADHSAKPGAGISVAKTLHRIEESVVRQELEAAGFKLIE